MSCAFCGMPSLDGEPCCNGEYRRKVMRDADRKIQEQRADLAHLRSDLAEARALVARMSDALDSFHDDYTELSEQARAFAEKQP